MTDGNGDSVERTVSRRRIVRGGGVGLALGLAGCLGGGGGDADTDTATDTEPATETPTATPTPEASLDQPVAPTAEDRCAVCNMKPANFPDWNAQLTLDGTRAHFCSPGCLVAFRSLPGEFVDGASRDAIRGAWVHDVATTDLIDATAASWVLDPDTERTGGPMAGNPLPYRDRADAEAYVDQYDDLTTHAIVGLGAFGHPVAVRYRAQFLPEATEPSILDAAEVPADATCPVCGMSPAKFPDANGQVSFEDGHRAYFDSPGCLGAYYADTGHFSDGRTQDGIVSAWTHDYGTKARIEALRASFVLETNGERVSDLPMATNPVPFAERADAEAYVDQYADLTAEDVVYLTEFTSEMGRMYREKHY